MVRRLVGHPEDTDDLVQEAMLRAHSKIETFRGQARFGTWLCTIGTRLALDYLRGRRRWRGDAQVHVKDYCHSDDARLREVKDTLASPDFAFDVYEHIAFCFTCVARSLSPEEEAAVVLREAMGVSNAEAASMIGVSESVLRHRLSSGRKAMQERFEGLCALINKNGACYQCEGLRDATPAERRGPSIPDLGGPGAGAEESYRVRLSVIQGADVDRGASQSFHDLVWRRMRHLEDTAAPAT